MNCRQVQKRLSRDFDRGLEPYGKMHRHVLNCRECTRFREDLTVLESVLQALPSVAAPGDLTVQILAATRDSQRLRPAMLRPVWAATVAIILSLVGGLWYGSRLESSQAADNQTAIAEAFSGNVPGSLWEFESIENSSQGGR